MISDAQLPAGIEYYLPLFFASTASLFDYLSRRHAAGDRRRCARRPRCRMGADRGTLRAAARRSRATDPRAGPGVHRAERAARAHRRPPDVDARLRTRCRTTRPSTPASRIRRPPASRRATTGSSRWLARGHRRAHLARHLLAGPSRDAARAAPRPRLCAARLRQLAGVRRRRRAARRDRCRARPRGYGSVRASCASSRRPISASSGRGSASANAARAIRRP